MAFQRFIPIWTISLLTACSTLESKNDITDLHFSQYSESVKDTFYIDVQLPKEYEANPNKKYPTLVFVDGNFYFPMMSAIFHQYENAGLLEPFIVVAVGYKSFKTMDSLRIRDYLFPKALPSDELNADGGGQHFYDYITKELLPKIDSDFRTDKADRTLLGHSFGGYFVLYSLFHQSTNQTDDFKSFISASPTLWYNDFYLNKLPDQLSTTEKNLGLFLSVGELEDSTWSVNPVRSLTRDLQKKQIKGLNFKSR
ncbi:MAG: alpha/beta hydrolase, partial [Dolichospermum sp.]|nr:alpha/beta hydrolase [Dolichospermum sp.]